MRKLLLILTFLVFVAFISKAQTVTDIDGNEYNVITIGNQIWIEENLKVTHYQNGDPIANVTDAAQWSMISTGAYCWYNNYISSKTTYGGLYNWYAVVDARKIAPAGWHIPNESEWQALIDNLGGQAASGGKLKEMGTTHWGSPNVEATNESGYTALPGGMRIRSGLFSNLGSTCHLWSNSPGNTGGGMNLVLESNTGSSFILENEKHCGFSVRCIKDNNTGIGDIIEQASITIFPNPADCKLNIYYPDNQKAFVLMMYDVFGKLIFHKQIEVNENVIDISSLKPGLYMVDIKNSFVERKLKFIKQ